VPRSCPILGYPTQGDACAALLDSGHSVEEIARKIGRSPTHVRAAVRRLRIAAKPRTFVLPLNLLRRLEPAAAARGIGPIELATQLFEVIVNEDVVDALIGEPGGDRA